MATAIERPVMPFTGKSHSWLVGFVRWDVVVDFAVLLPNQVLCSRLGSAWSRAASSFMVPLALPRFAGPAMVEFQAGCCSSWSLSYSTGVR